MISLSRDLLEFEMLAAGNDRGRDLVELRRREDEDGVGGRLLEGLEQGVERGPGDLVDLVDDDDLVPAVDRLVLNALAEGPDLVDAAARGAVDLEDVDGAVLDDRHAFLADVAGRGRRALDAVQGFGQDPGGRRLAGAPHPREQIGLGHALRPDGVLKGLDDGPLADHVLKCLRPVLAGEY